MTWKLVSITVLSITFIHGPILTYVYHNKHFSIQAWMIEGSLYYLDTSIVICSVACYYQECCETLTFFESSLQALQLRKWICKIQLMEMTWQNMYSRPAEELSWQQLIIKKPERSIIAWATRCQIYFRHFLLVPFCHMNNIITFTSIYRAVNQCLF